MKLVKCKVQVEDKFYTNYYLVEGKIYLQVAPAFKANSKDWYKLSIIAEEDNDFASLVDYASKSND